jgi:hypothetical protein
MSDSDVRVATPGNIYTDFVNPGHEAPKPEEIYLLPISFVGCLRQIGPKLDASGAWWSVGGDLSENLAGVTVNPKEIQILTNKDGIGKVHECLREYGPPPIALLETTLDREADIQGKKYPVYVRSHSFALDIRGAPVVFHGDYQMKVGEWDWGDPLEFEPSRVFIVSTPVPVMPARLRSEIYISLGWLDRAQMIGDAITRAHHGVNQPGYGFT